MMQIYYLWKRNKEERTFTNKPNIVTSVPAKLPLGLLFAKAFPYPESDIKVVQSFFSKKKFYIYENDFYVASVKVLNKTHLRTRLSNKFERDTRDFIQIKLANAFLKWKKNHQMDTFSDTNRRFREAMEKTQDV